MRGFLLLCLSMVLGLCRAAAESIQLGYITDLSGKGAPLGVMSQIGATLAQEDLTKEGFSVTVRFGDHRTEAKQALSEAQRLLDGEQVQGLLCDLTQPCIPVADLALQRRRLFFYQSPAESILERNPYAFRNFLDYHDGCQAIAEQWKSQGITNVGGILVSAEYSELCRKGIISVFPLAKLQDISEDDDSQLRSLLLKLKSAGIHASFVTGFERQFINVFRMRRELKLDFTFGVSGPLLTSLVRQAGADNPASVFSFNFPALDPSFRERVLQRVRSGSTTNLESAAIAYTAVQQEARAIKECGSTNLDCQISSISKEHWSPIPISAWKGRKAVYAQLVHRGW